MQNEATRKFDVVIIGTGPGGEGASMEATKRGLSVCAVERMAEIGGACTHLGTIPSKSLRTSIYRLLDNSALIPRSSQPEVSFQDLRRSAQNVISQQVRMRGGFYERNEVELFNGQASLRSPHQVEVEHADGSITILQTRFIVIATGSRPYHPPDINFAHPRVYDSDTILNLPETPRSMTIYGAGVIGCEYASMFRNLGVKLNLINTRPRVLEFLDDEICDALSYHMRDTGIRIRNDETFEHLETHDDHVVMHLKSGKALKSDVLLWANGRTGNTDQLGLQNTSIEPNHRGQIPVNEHLQTSEEHIYAVGDVIGVPALASAAYIQGRYAASHLANGETEQLRLLDIPSGIYTSPEISSVGRTEKELTEACIPYEVGHSMFKNLARAQIMGRPIGMLKLLFHRETLEILGVHCFGVNASEIVHIGQAIMAQPAPQNSLMYFINTTFNYPTMAEAYRVAALNGYNRLM